MHGILYILQLTNPFLSFEDLCKIGMTCVWSPYCYIANDKISLTESLISLQLAQMSPRLTIFSLDSGWT
jgi:hypothetical protein